MDLCRKIEQPALTTSLNSMVLFWHWLGKSDNNDGITTFIWTGCAKCKARGQRIIFRRRHMQIKILLILTTDKGLKIDAAI